MSCVDPSGGVLVMIKIFSYELPKSIFWLQLTITNKVTEHSLDTAAHLLNLSTSEYETGNPTECNTSTRSRDRDTSRKNSSIAIEVEINILHSYKTASMDVLR